MKYFIFLLLFSFSKIHSYEYDLAICAIFQNDAKYIPEWIEFHHRQGVQHFFLYNNLREDNPESYLKPYIDIGLVEVIDWSYTYEDCDWNNMQLNAYNDCLSNNKKYCKWIAFLDTDEFLFSPDFKDLKKVLKKYDKFSAVGVNWVMYGTSNVSCPDGKILNHLVYRAILSEGANIHIKSIVKAKYATFVYNPHCCVYKTGNCVGENFDVIDGPFANKHSVNILRINHYWSRDIDFFYNVKLPRRERWGQPKQSCIDVEKTYNEVYDPILVDR